MLIPAAGRDRAASAGQIAVPGGVDPRHAEGRLRGWPLGLARTLFTVAGIRRVIGLLEPGKLDALYLHLTDGHSWRLPAGPRRPGAACGSGEDLRALAGYAADRFVTVVPRGRPARARVRAHAAAPGLLCRRFDLGNQTPTRSPAFPGVLLGRGVPV